MPCSLFNISDINSGDGISPVTPFHSKPLLEARLLSAGPRLDAVSERLDSIQTRISSVNLVKEKDHFIDNIGTSLDRKRLDWHPKTIQFLYLFTTKNRPQNVVIAYERCLSKPELHLLDAFRDDGKSCAKVIGECNDPSCTQILNFIIKIYMNL